MVSTSSSSSSSSSKKSSKKLKRSKSSSAERRQAPSSSSSSSSSANTPSPNNPPPPPHYPRPSSVSSSSTIQSLVVLVGPTSSCSSAPAALTTTRTTAESIMVVAGTGREGSACSAESQWRPGKRGIDLRGKTEVDTPMGKDPKCIVCGKEFMSWKAYFGHLRTHPERQWRGAFPPNPPGLTAEERRLLEQELAPTLLGIAADIKARVALNVVPPAPRRVLLDLNRSPPPEEEENNDNDDNNDEKGDEN